MKLQLNGFATILGSKKLPLEIKEQILKASNGKFKRLQSTFKDAEGNKIFLKGKLELSKSGSLMCRYVMKIDSFELVDVDAPKPKSKEEKQEERTNKLASDLLNNL